MHGQSPATGSIRRYWWLLALAIVLAAVLPFVLESWTLSIVVRMLVLALFGLAFNVAYGYTGLASFGHAAFYGLGGYAFGLGLIHLSPQSVVLPLVLGLLAPLLYGAFTAVFSTRGRGIYFALLTFAFAQIIYEITVRWSDLLGGTQGLFVSTPPVLGLTLWDTTVIYYLTAAMFILSGLVLFRFVTSPFGTVMRAVKENEERARAIGYPVKRIKIAVFVVSAGFAGVAGILHSISNQYVSPSMLHFTTSIDALIVAMLGGVSFFLGPVVGAVVLVGIRVLAQGYANIGIVLTGVVFIVIVMFMPDGMLGFADALRSTDESGSDSGTDQSGDLPDDRS